jgi:hypothetical protein
VILRWNRSCNGCAALLLTLALVALESHDDDSDDDDDDDKESMLSDDVDMSMGASVCVPKGVPLTAVDGTLTTVGSCRCDS